MVVPRDPSTPMTQQPPRPSSTPYRSDKPIAGGADTISSISGNTLTPQQIAAATAAGLPTKPPKEQTKPPYVNYAVNSKSETDFPYGHDRVTLKRGYIMRLAERAAARTSEYIPASKRYKFRFLYNPESVTYSTNVYAGSVPPEYGNPNDVLTARFIGQETVSFGLMLDRTQEAYEQGDKTRGTLPDLEALYRVVNGNPGLNTGFLYLSTIVIYWEPTNLVSSLPPFYGYITNINVEHNQFNPRMCPTRSIVSISAARLASAAGVQRAGQLYGGSVYSPTGTG